MVFAENQLLPQLDLELSFGYNGLGGDFSDSFSDFGRDKDPDWSVGLLFSVPLNRDAERARLREARRTKEQALITAKQTETQLLVLVDNSLGEIESARERIEIVQESVELARDALRAEERRLASGLTTKLTVGQTISGLVLPYREVKLSSPVQSFITELKVREGAEVEKDDLLAQLYVRTEELEMERYKAALRKREFESKGAENLFADQLISEDEALASEIELRLARLQFEIAEEAVRLRQIRAPISGVIVERNYEKGEMVTVGEPLFKLVDISSVFVQFYVPMEEARNFPEGTSVRLNIPELGEDGPVLRGTVDFIDPQVDPASGLLKIKVLAPNKERAVKPGLRAEVHLAQGEE